MNFKRFMVMPILILLIALLTGCTHGKISKNSQAVTPPANPPVAQASNQQNSPQQSLPGTDNTAQQQTNIQSTPPPSVQSQAEIDQKIDQQLDSLDKALDSLDKGTGTLQ